MFDIGASELLLIAIVAIVVIGPKDMPLAMRTAGRWIGKIRRVSNHFRTGVEAMIREAELEEMEKKWREQNKAIMEKYPDAEALAPPAASAETRAAAQPDSPAASESEPGAETGRKEPELPLGGPPPPP